MDEKTCLFFESPRGNIEFIYAGADRHRIALLWESERWNNGIGYYSPAHDITPAEALALVDFFLERYRNSGKIFIQKTLTDFEIRYPGQLPSDILDVFGNSVSSLERLKNEYYELYNYDSRLPELFDLIPSYKLRQYLTEQIRKAAANE